MLKFEQKKLDELNSVDESDIYILTDFDDTVTKDNNFSSWTSVFLNPKTNQEFIEVCSGIYKKYHKFEVDSSLSYKEKRKIMDEWYKVNVQTVVDFKVTREIIESAASSMKRAQMRSGAKKFFKTMHEKGIPVLIISAGVGNVIELFLREMGCLYDNVHIYSNFFEYKDDVVIGVKDNAVVHPLNKQDVITDPIVWNEIKKRHNAILIGNSVNDIKMILNDKHNVFKIGFISGDEDMKECIEKYDIVCSNDESYTGLETLIDLFK